MSVRKVKQIIAVKVTGYIELPAKDVKAASAILNTFVAAQDSGDYSELFKLMKIEKVDANTVRRTFEEPVNVELVPQSIEIRSKVGVMGERDEGTQLFDPETGEVTEEGRDLGFGQIEGEVEDESDDVPAFAKKFA